MKILFLTNLIPFPLDNGGKIKTYNTIETMSQFAEIDLFCFYEEDYEREYIKSLNHLCKDIVAIKKTITTSKNLSYMKKVAFKSLFSMLPMTVKKFLDKGMEEQLQNYLKRKEYDVIYIDHLQLAGYYNILDNAKSKIILDEHNCETKIIKRMNKEENSILKKIFLKYEEVKLSNFEAKITRLCHKVLVLSNEDRDSILKLDKRIDETNIRIIPIMTNDNFIKDNFYKKDILNILFLGTLSWYPNHQGIEWFINKVTPILDNNNVRYRLNIVGKGSSKELQELCIRHNSINLIGYVEDINEEIQKNDLMIVPLFIGSGMRVKILEAIARKIPVISTSVGAEGIKVNDKESILFAENEREFYECIVDCFDENLREKLAVNGRKVFDGNYSKEAIGKLLREEIYSVK